MGSQGWVPGFTQRIFQSGRQAGFSLSREGYVGSERKTIHPEAFPWASLANRAGVDRMPGYNLRMVVCQGGADLAFLFF